MVMTQTSRPRQSFQGLVLVVGVIGLGWLLTPALSSAQTVADTPKPEAVEVAASGQVAGTGSASAAPAVPLFAPETPRPAVPPREAPAPRAAGETASRTYHLSGGKLELLTKLLSRDDVPLKIRPRPDGIEVIATPAEHEAVAAFIREIDADNSPPQWQEYPLPDGKLDALYELMAREDVHIVVSRDDGVLRANVTPQQDQVLRGFLAAIDPDGRAARPAKRPPAKTKVRAYGGLLQPGQPATPQPSLAPPAPLMPPVATLPPVPPTPPVAPIPPVPPIPPQPRMPGPKPGVRAGRAPEAAALEAQLEALHRQQAEQQQRSEPRIKGLQAKAAAAEKRAAEIEAQSEAVEQNIERLKAAAAAGSNAAHRKELERQARQLEKNSQKLQAELERLEALSDSLDEQADAEESRGDELDSAVDQLVARLESLNEMNSDQDEDTDMEDDSQDDAATLYGTGAQALALREWAKAYGSSSGVINLSPSAAQGWLVAPGGGAYARGGTIGTTNADKLSGDIRARVRASLRAALAEASSDQTLNNADIDALCERINEMVSTLVTQSLQQAMHNVEIEVSAHARAYAPGRAESGKDATHDCTPQPPNSDNDDGPAHHTPLE